VIGDRMVNLIYFRKLTKYRNRYRLSIPVEVAKALDSSGSGELGLIWDGKTLTVATAPERV